MNICFGAPNKCAIADDDEAKLDLFEQINKFVLNEQAPIIVKGVKPVKQPPWINADLAKAKAAIDRLFNCAKHSNDPRVLATYRRVNHDIRKAKRYFFFNSQSPKPRMIRNHIKSSLATTNAVQPRQTNQNLRSQPHAKMMADQFNEHFAMITSKFGTTTTTVKLLKSHYSRLRTYILDKRTLKMYHLNCHI